MRRRKTEATGRPEPPIIDVRDVSHSFEADQPAVLRSVTFSLERGGFLFLTGPSGAGKTTLLNLLHGSMKPRRGELTVAGFDLTRLSARRLPRLRREVSVVFQDFKILLERTAYQNVALALEARGVARAQIDRRVRAMLRVLHLEKRAHAPCRELAGGEQQRVAIARSMVVNPRLILADEPTGNLDQALAFRILDVFRLFNSHGATFVMATHNRELLASFPEAKILTLKDGAIASANWPGGQPSGPREPEAAPRRGGRT